MFLFVLNYFITILQSYAVSDNIRDVHFSLRFDNLFSTIKFIRFIHLWIHSPMSLNITHSSAWRIFVSRSTHLRTTPSAWRTSPDWGQIGLTKMSRSPSLSSLASRFSSSNALDMISSSAIICLEVLTKLFINTTSFAVVPSGKTRTCELRAYVTDPADPWRNHQHLARRQLAFFFKLQL